MTSKTTATIKVRGLLFISFIGGRGQVFDYTQIFADFILQIVKGDVRDVRGGNYIFSGVGAVIDQRGQPGLLFIDTLIARGGGVSQLLVGKEQGRGQGVGDLAMFVGFGCVDDLETFSSGPIVGGNGVGLGLQDIRLARFR